MEQDTKAVNYEELYNSLKTEKEELETKHNTLKGEYDSLKNDYIEICRGHKSNENKTDEFDELCGQKFDRVIKNNKSEDK